MSYFKKLLEGKTPWMIEEVNYNLITNYPDEYLPNDFPKSSPRSLWFEDNLNLKSLKNCSTHINGDFVLDKTPKLESLIGFPKIIDGDVEISNCENAYHDLWRMGYSIIKGSIFIWDHADLSNVCKKYKNCEPRDILRFQNEVEDILDLI